MMNEEDEKEFDPAAAAADQAAALAQLGFALGVGRVRPKEDPATERARKSASVAELRRQRKADGLCIHCGSAMAKPTHVRCARCRSAQRKIDRRWRRKQDRSAMNARDAASHRRRRDARRAAGLCTDCARPKPPGRFQSRCVECTARATETNRLRRERMKESAS